MKLKTRYVADVLVGILTATSVIWVDVNLLHRFAIAIMVTLAVETLFQWIDERCSSEEEEYDDSEEDERKNQNRKVIIGNWLEKERL